MYDYHLYPPFFIVPEESDFADAWESFCCKLLCLSEKNTKIYRRYAPEQGVDLYYPDRKIAYQCKSVESGRSRDFDANKTINSIKSALAAKSTIPWTTYVICTNVDVTGTAEKKIRNELPDVGLAPRSTWQILCEQNAGHVARYFRILVEMPQKQFTEAFDATFSSYYSDELKRKLAEKSFDVLLYSRSYNRIFLLPASPGFKLGDLMEVLRKHFRLPESTEIKRKQLSISLKHYIVIDGKEQDCDKTLAELGIGPNTVLLYCVDLEFQRGSGIVRSEKVLGASRKLTREENLSEGSGNQNQVSIIRESVERELGRALDTFYESFQDKRGAS